jgi:sugar-specific transcriptional regulator TrmB
MDEITLNDLIRKLGFSEYETKCYLALFERDKLTVSEAATLAGIPRTNAYEIMEKLLIRGLAISYPGKVKQYAAADPSAFQTKMMESVQSTVKTIEMATAKLKELYVQSRGENIPINYIEIIKDHYQAHKRFVQLSEASKDEILVLAKRSQTAHFREASGPPESDTRRKSVFEKGVRVRCIYDLWPDENDNKMLLKSIESFAKAGEEARVVDNLPMRLAIFDSRIVMFVLLETISAELAISNPTVQIIEHPAMAESLKMLFESIWQKAEPFEDYRARYYSKNDRKLIK